MNKLQALGLRSKTWAKGHNAELLMIGGTVSFGATIFFTWQAAKKMPNVKAAHDWSLGCIKRDKAVSDENDADMREANTTGEELMAGYPDKDYKRDLTMAYLHTGLSTLKVMSPVIICGGATIGMFTGAHKIMRSRNIALAAAYTSLDKSFNQYRSRVVEDQGNDADYRYRTGAVTEKYKETIVDENGKSKTVTKTKEVINPDGVSQYSVFLCEDTCNRWIDDPASMMTYINQQELYMNDLYNANGGKILLMDALDVLGVKRTDISRIAGWDSSNPLADDKISFGLDKLSTAAYEDFMNGVTSGILLDFNVVGAVNY